MNHVQMPSRWNYAIAGLILLASMGVVAYLIFSSIRGMQDNLQQVLVPGRSDITLSSPGRYTVFHEHRSTYQNRVFNTGELPGLQTALVRKSDGREIPLQPTTMSESYTVLGREGSSVFQFEIDQPGTYEFRAWYPSGEGPEAVFTIGRGVVKGLFKAIAGMCGVTMLAMIISLVIVIRTAIGRSRAQQAYRTAPTGAMR